MNSKYGLKTFPDLASEKQCVPDKPLRGDIIPETELAIRKIDDIDLLERIMELFLLSLTDPFVADTQCHLFSYIDTALERLILIDAEAVVKCLNSVLKEHDEKELVKSHSNHLIAQCENSIKIDYDKPLTRKEALELYDKLTEEHS